MSAIKKPVIYTTELYNTTQDYLIMEPLNVTLYIKKKRRRVTLRVATSKKDTRKSETSTFVNFIHQKDAHIAMDVLNSLRLDSLKHKEEQVPIYTVHDNFLTIPKHADLVPKFYSQAFQEMGPPLLIINLFLIKNLFREHRPIYREKMYRGTLSERLNQFYYDLDSKVYYDLDSKGRSLDKVFDKDLLTEVLNDLSENVSKARLQPWKKKVDKILSSYMKYCLIVCGVKASALPNDIMELHNLMANEDLMQYHVMKWDSFSSSLVAKEGEDYNCVHY